MGHRTSIKLRWRDMDMLGHLNQSVYHELLEEARGSLIMRLAETATDHWTWVLARVELDYRTEIRKDHDVIDVDVRVERIGTKSMTLVHDVLLPDGTVAATGRSVLVGWDATRRGAREISPAERAALEQAR